MKRMSKALAILVATVTVGLGASGRAEATAITIDNVVITSGQVDADIVVSALNEASGGFGLQVTYNAADFTGASFTNDPTDKFGDVLNPNIDFSGGFGFPGPGFLDLGILAGYVLEADLQAAQGPFPASFVLAHVTFDRSSSTAGTDLGLANVSLSNWNGDRTIPLGDIPVPEPASMLLVGTGLAGLVARRKLNRARQ